MRALAGGFGKWYVAKSRTRRACLYVASTFNGDLNDSTRMPRPSTVTYGLYLEVDEAPVNDGAPVNKSRTAWLRVDEAPVNKSCTTWLPAEAEDDEVQIGGIDDVLKGEWSLVNGKKFRGTMPSHDGQQPNAAASVPVLAVRTLTDDTLTSSANGR
jgi:hypothetical protein